MPLQSKNKALVIIDMQNEFIHPDGFLAKNGPQMGFKQELLAATVPSVKRLLTHARQINIPVIHIYTAWNSDHSDRAMPMLIPEAMNVKILIEGTWGAEIIQELTPIAGEHKILKKSYGAFFQTSLDRLIRNLQVKNLIICGILTNLCVETTIREGVSLGYDITLASDATATVDEQWYSVSLQTVKLFFGSVATTEELIKEIK